LQLAQELGAQIQATDAVGIWKNDMQMPGLGVVVSPSQHGDLEQFLQVPKGLD
jgi:hypothetical protein